MEIKIPEPNEKQKLLFTDTHRYIGYGGARGGGKSWGLRVKALLLAFEYPGIRTMIMRKTNAELLSNHIQPLCEMLRIGDPTVEQVAKYSDINKQLTFVNGSRIIFGYCDSDKDLERYQGQEIDILMVDEATQQTEERLKKLNASVRGVNGFPKRTYYTMNPGGPGHAWAKRVFIDRNYRKGENPADYSFIQALVTDNKALMEADPNYIRQLESLSDVYRKMWLEGRWDVTEGQYFEDFRVDPDIEAARAHGCFLSEEELRRQERWVHVIEPFRLDRDEYRSWNIFRSYDFGYAKPFSCGWWAVDHDGVMYRILEYYGWNGEPNQGCRMSVEDQFAAIAKIEREHPWLRGREISGVADPSIWDSSRGESIAEVAQKQGLYFSRGDNSRVAGWMQCHERLRFDENGKAMMYVFRKCTDFIRTIPLLQHSKTQPEDLDTEGEDHIADEWRYACMSRPYTPPLPRIPKPFVADPLQPF